MTINKSVDHAQDISELQCLQALHQMQQVQQGKPDMFDSKPASDARSTLTFQPTKIPPLCVSLASKQLAHSLHLPQGALLPTCVHHCCRMLAHCCED